MKAIYKNKLVEVDYINENDIYARANGEWVEKKDLIIIPTEWTTYALIAIGAYLVGLVTNLIIL